MRVTARWPNGAIGCARRLAWCRARMSECVFWACAEREHTFTAAALSAGKSSLRRRWLGAGRLHGTLRGRLDMWHRRDRGNAFWRALPETAVGEAEPAPAQPAQQ